MIDTPPATMFNPSNLIAHYATWVAVRWVELVHRQTQTWLVERNTSVYLLMSA